MVFELDGKLLTDSLRRLKRFFPPYFPHFPHFYMQYLMTFIRNITQSQNTNMKIESEKKISPLMNYLMSLEAKLMLISLSPLPSILHYVSLSLSCLLYFLQSYTLHFFFQRKKTSVWSLMLSQTVLLQKSGVAWFIQYLYSQLHILRRVLSRLINEQPSLNLVWTHTAIPQLTLHTNETVGDSLLLLLLILVQWWSQTLYLRVLGAPQILDKRKQKTVLQ